MAEKREVQNLTRIGQLLAELVQGVDQLRAADDGTALHGIVGLAEHVLGARDDLATARDIVDQEIGRRVRETPEGAVVSLEVGA